MSKLLMGLAAAAALVSLTNLAFADGAAPPVAVQPVSNVQPVALVTCHHDGEVIQGPSGPVICRLRKSEPGTRNYSQEWFRELQARSSMMNGH